jgi:hypothetical protein
MDSLAQQAQAGLRQIEDAIVALLRRNPDGLQNAQIAKSLGIETGKPHRNMLTWSIIGRLLQAGHVERLKKGQQVTIRLTRM